MLGIYARLFIWLITVFLVFTNVYLIWEYMFFSQNTLTAEVFIPVLIFLTLVYLFCIYHIGKDDVDAFGVSSASFVGFVGNKNLFKPSKLPDDDPDNMTATTSFEISTTTTDSISTILRR